MAPQNQNVCSFNKYGFCKFKLNCRKQHIMEKCSKTNCEIHSCSSRHPRTCRYYRDIGYCKFGEFCLFNHDKRSNCLEESHKISKKIETIEKTIEEKNNNIEQLENALKDKRNSQLEEVLEKVDSKIDVFQSNILTLKTCVAEKDSIISNLEKIITDMQIKMEALENKVSLCEKDVKKNNLDDKVKELEENQIFMIEEANGKYKCNHCEFTTYHAKGLKIHKKKMHKSYYCEVCDDVFDAARDLKIHKFTHSYTKTESLMKKCRTCDFQCTSIDTMEVHIGKCRNEDFECGLCEATFNKLDDLEIHLKTCEVYQCAMCLIRGKNLSEMKSHIEDNHSKSTGIGYLKMDRNDQNDVSSKYYTLSDL